MTNYNPLIVCKTCKTNTRHVFVDSKHGQMDHVGKECKDRFAWFHIYHCSICDLPRIYGATKAKPDKSGIINEGGTIYKVTPTE